MSRFLAPLLLTAAAVAGLAALLLWLPVSHPMKRGLRTERINSLVRIRDALRRYSEASNSFPENLSDLFPSFLAQSNTALFLGPSSATNGRWLVSAAARTNAKAVDTAGFYVYLWPSTVAGHCIVVERPGIWITGVDRWLDGGLYTIDDTFNVIFRPLGSLPASLQTNREGVRP